MFPILAAGSTEATIASLPAFVVAHDGLYLRKRSLLGVSQTKVDGAEHLPPEKEYLEYALPKVPTDLMARVVGFFRAVYRAQRTEALVLLLWAGEGFDLFVPDQRVSPASVSHTLDEAELPSGSRVVGSIHSHGVFGAWASSIDQDDEAEFDGLHVVVGDFDRGRPSYSAAIAVDGHRFAVRTSVVLERPRRLVEPPEDWLRRVKLRPPPRPSKTVPALGSNGAAASVPGRGTSRAGRVDLDVALARADRLAGELGLHLSYWLVPASGSSRKGGGTDV
jgi:proteasome lid subunit RPN8/RPN11